MKKFITLIICSAVVLISCSNDDWNNQNPYLPEMAVNVPINTSLPTYNTLNYPGNAIYIGGYGIKGILVINTRTGIRAIEATCVNHRNRFCSKLTLERSEAK